MSDAQDIVAKIEGMIAYNERGQPIDVYALYDVAEKAGPCIRALLSKCELMEKVVEAARKIIAMDEADEAAFDGDSGANFGYACGMTTAATELRPALAALDAVHSDGNTSGGVIRTEDKPNA